MRLRTLIPVGIAGTALYAARNTKLVRRQIIAPLAGVTGGALGKVRDRLENIAQPDPKSPRARQLDDEASLDDLDIAARDIVDQLSGVEPAGMQISDAIDLEQASLVEAERELLTTPGREHRRRRQTAGPAAQEIAAAQVRDRRNGIDSSSTEDWDG
jgi:hypothetical protein